MRLHSIAHGIGFFLAASSAFATIDVTEQLGIRSRAMGGAGRAVATTNEAMYLNPAGLTQFQRFNIDADYQYRLDDPLHLIGISLVDSTTTPLAGGIDFHLAVDPATGDNSLGYLGSFALSYMAAEDLIYVGATGKYSFLPKTASDQVEVNQFGLDAGMLIRLGYGFSLGAAGYNLVPTNSKRLPMSVGFGAAFNAGGTPAGSKDVVSALEGFTLAVDWLMRDINKAKLEHQLMLGGEYLFLDFAPLRVGYSTTINAAKNEHIVSGGAGFIASDFGLDGFYEQNLTTTSKRSFGFAMRLYF